MAGFSQLSAEATTYASATTKDTAFSVAPAIGDIVAFILENTTEADPHLSHPDATFVLLDADEVGDGSDQYAVYRCTVAGTSGVLTVSQDTDGFTGHSIAVYRPTDLDYVGIVNTSGVIDSTTSGADLTVALTTSGSPAALLGLCAVSADIAFDADPNWTQLDGYTGADAINIGSQYKLSDDTEWFVDPTTGSGLDIAGLVLEFSAAGGGAAQKLTDTILLASPLLSTPLVR